MTSTPASVSGRPLTAKGLATRARIVASASDLMLKLGVDRTTIDDIQRAATVTTSQLYHYFVDKNDLIMAVIDYQTDAVLDVHRTALESVDDFDGLVAWRDTIVEVLTRQHCVGGCPLGSLASDLAEVNPRARAALERSFGAWESLLRQGLATMHARGILPPDVDLDRAALALLAAVQGGLLLSQTRRDTVALESAIDFAIDSLRLRAAA
ncbi:TetR/AcrR family transcriptional regulator [Frondihabitans australicus]|uniref:TetR family transcriptional regulator n=1 Tax=Frondihabitans australicus TaxID=386892 RepID=A0A495IFJ0_9MICO|nr:TetR/AcrR family transcriptional regulator [Frondihabitans australicus]RKR74420.1 TetR family transcriptional regulator [Frondihabitans australicus]